MMSSVTLILAYCTMLDIVQAQVFATISPEEDYTVALHPSSLVQFNCTVTEADVIQWRVDNISASDSDIANRGVIITTTVEISEETFMSMLFIPADMKNDNTSIQCRVYDLRSEPISFVDSKLLYFRVQGLLGPPPNTSISESSDGLIRVLSWDAPLTLDIAGIDPDIQSYQVCYNLTDDLMCISVDSSDKREFTFPNVAVSLLFTVSAINVLGEGNASSAVHKACNNDEDPNPFSVSGNNVKCQSRFRAKKRNLSVTCNIQQTTVCFGVYKVETTPLLEIPVTTKHGLRIPMVTNNYSDASGTWLSLTITKNLKENELYSVNIITVNCNGETNSTDNIQFSTYDIQSVSGITVAGGLELSCTFAKGSQAQSCILTICKKENVNIIEGSCVNIHISRSVSKERVTNLSPGLYAIVEIAEVESNGNETILRPGGELELFDVELIAQANRSTIPESPPSYNLTEKLNPTIIGGCLATMLTFILSISTLIIVVYWCRHKKQLNNYNDQTSGCQSTEPDEELWAKHSIPQSLMEDCPAYGVLGRRNRTDMQIN